MIFQELNLNNNDFFFIIYCFCQKNNNDKTYIFDKFAIVSSDDN